MTRSTKRVVIVGAGPAGLTAAHELARRRIDTLVLEKAPGVGGLARTDRFRGYRFDIGGHRFFTKIDAVESMWKEVLGRDLLRRRRRSRIYYRKRFFDYPLKIRNTVLGLGLWNSLLVLLSYLRAQLTPSREPATFEDWVSKRFGKRMYRIFFKTYTEKVWGIPCDELSADWAEQRIRGLSLFGAIRNVLIPRRDAEAVRTLIDSFHYPKLGPGMMWERVAELFRRHGGKLRTDTDVKRIFWSGGRVTGVEAIRGDRRERFHPTHIVSTMPLQDLVRRLEPAPPREVLDAAERLHYRDFMMIVLIVDKQQLFDDNWIYVHEPDVRVGRIQNFKNWSPHMVPDPRKTCLGLEYFCSRGDDLWSMSDERLLELGAREMETLGFLERNQVEDGTVVRVPQAYPVYDAGYLEALRRIRTFVDGLTNLHPVGRNGMHKYNNQDHSMYTAMLAVRNILGEALDVWSVNAGSEYHEEVDARLADERAALESTQPPVPKRRGDDRCPAT